MIRIRPLGWKYKDWEGVVYPSPAPRGFDALAYIAGTLHYRRGEFVILRSAAAGNGTKMAPQRQPQSTVPIHREALSLVYPREEAQT